MNSHNWTGIQPAKLSDRGQETAPNNPIWSIIFIKGVKQSGDVSSDKWAGSADVSGSQSPNNTYPVLPAHVLFSNDLQRKAPLNECALPAEVHLHSVKHV